MLPDGDMLVTERVGRLRLVHDGELDPVPLSGLPEIFVGGQTGLLDVVLHPDFERNRQVYFSYARAQGDSNSLAVARGRLAGHALVDVEDILITNAWAENDSRFAQSGHGGRLAFDRDGHLYVTSGDRTFGYGDEAQDPSNHSGAVLRINDDGSVPRDNPFVGRRGYAPEIYSFGHRNPQGLAIHPDTNLAWVSEHGPQGGDELNVILAGHNYGWPIVSHGRGYDGVELGEGAASGAGFEAPIVHWSPAIGPSGLLFYTGERFPAWKGSAFIGAMGRVAAGHLERQVFTDEGPIGGEVILGTLQQRIRDVRQGTDGALYLLTEYADGALLKVEPARAPQLSEQRAHFPERETAGTDLQQPSPPLGPGPWVFDTAQEKIRVSVVAANLSRPFSMAFLPNGDMLVTELPGRLRLVRDGQLDPVPISGVPAVHAVVASGLKDVAVHPQFDQTRWVYLSYIKPGQDGASTTAIARGRLDGHALEDVEDIFVAEAWSSRDADSGTRLAFDRDGMLYASLGDRFALEDVQSLDSHFGKVLRLRDDGSIPSDNPFAELGGTAAAIYTIGHRNPQGLAMNPWTGEIWETEHGPQGGDELNRLIPAANYGWPLASFGTDYGGTPVSDTPVRPDFRSPQLFWVPGIAPSGLAFYAGERFPSWYGDVFIGSMHRNASGHLLRVVFDAQGLEVGQEALLTELRQRIRDVRAGPDGLLYVATDEAAGAVLRIEPVADD
jgi:glucose/arabinose dehydrogenase